MVGDIVPNRKAESMSLRLFPPAIVPMIGAILAVLLTSCANESPATVPTTAPTTTASRVPEEAGPPSVRTLPPSSLCLAFDLAAAQTVSANLRFTPQAGTDQGAAADACTYTNEDGTAVLSLAPATRPYDTELALAHDVERDPGSSGMTGVRVETVTGLGQAAFSETGVVVKPQQNITYVVWRSGSRAWVLSLAEVEKTDLTGRVAPLARQISPRLPQ